MQINQILPSQSIRVILQLWIVDKENIGETPYNMRPIGWSSFDLFPDGSAIQYGRWYVKLIPIILLI